MLRSQSGENVVTREIRRFDALDCFRPQFIVGRQVLIIIIIALRQLKIDTNLLWRTESISGGNNMVGAPIPAVFLVEIWCRVSVEWLQQRCHHKGSLLNQSNRSGTHQTPQEGRPLPEAAHSRPGKGKIYTTNVCSMYKPTRYYKPGGVPALRSKQNVTEQIMKAMTPTKRFEVDMCVL